MDICEKYKIKILYEDNHIIVVQKPVNIPSQGDSSGDIDMLTILKDYIKIKYEKSGDVFLGLVQRLDRPVGGLMVFARTSKAASRLSKEIRNKEFKKVYLAVAQGKIKKTKDLLKHYLLKDEKTNIVSAFNESVNGSKEAILEYEVLQIAGNLSLIKVNLHTGRSHQIRVQLSKIGHPLFGDQKYGGELSKKGQQIALWSAKLEFTHPTLKEKMEFKLLPPQNEPWNKFNFENLKS